MFLTGSRALNWWYPEQFPIKDNTDWDLVGDNIKSDQSCLVDVGPDGLLSKEICEHYNSGETIPTPYGPAYVVYPVCVMLFKRSHLHRPIKFAKHIRDYHWLKSRQYEKAGDNTYNDFLKERTKLTKEKYGDKTPSLKQKTNDFFDDYVTKKYKHDDLHLATCYGERPLYESLKTDNDLVWCSKSKWNSLSHSDQINCVREEAFVIALERYLINKKGYPAKFAFNNAVERICTTLTSGWFRDFAIENWAEIVDCDYDFVGKFKQAGFTFNY
jgi:hypothetical protein